MGFRIVLRAVCLLGCLGIAVETAPNSFAADQDEKLVPLLKTFVEEFVEITPGEGKFPKSFQMGSQQGDDSEQPVHEVTLKEKFSIAKYEVPQNLYEAVMGENPSKWKGKRNSVEMMTYDEVVKFCSKLTQMLQQQELIARDETIRLPTEAEWEYCCRAGTTTEYSFGDKATKEGDAGAKASILDGYGWHTGNAAGNDPPVGAKKPNPWGLYDMHGYLWEFTQDDWGGDYEHAHDDGRPTKIEKDDRSPAKITLRSGSWKNEHPRLRSAARIGFPKDGRDDAVGFRCVKSRETKSP